jgi:hypothetical protein
VASGEVATVRKRPISHELPNADVHPAALPPETSQRIAMWALNSGLWRVAVVADALLTLAWTAPIVLVFRLIRRRRGAS